MVVAILGPPWFQFTAMYLLIHSQLFTKSAACFYFPSQIPRLRVWYLLQVDFWKCLSLVLAPPFILDFSSFTVGWFWILRPTWKLLSRVLTPPFLIILILTPPGHPIDPLKIGYMLWSCINVDSFLKGDRPFQYPNHSGLPSLVPITKIYYIFVSTFIEITRIRINLCSFCTNIYSIEPLHTWTNSRSLYTKTYGIELFHVLYILWCITFLPYPDIRVIFDEHIICVILVFVPIIGWDIHFPCPWYQSYFSCPVFFCGSSIVMPIQKAKLKRVQKWFDIIMNIYIYVKEWFLLQQ